MSLLRPTSTLARAVLPVLGGAVLLAAIFAGTWGVAAVMSRQDNATERLAPQVFEVGHVEWVADEIDETGPLLFPNLDSTTAHRVVVLDHDGVDPTRGWRVSWGYPADAGPDCPVQQVEETERFTDCDGRELTADDLARDTTLCPIVEARVTLSIGLRADVCTVPES